MVDRSLPSTDPVSDPNRRAALMHNLTDLHAEDRLADDFLYVADLPFVIPIQEPDDDCGSIAFEALDDEGEHVSVINRQIQVTKIEATSCNGKLV